MDCVPFSGIEHNWNNVEITGNYAVDNGGGLYVDGVNLSSADNYLDLVYTGNDIGLNTAEDYGGGIYVYSAATLYLKDIRIYLNEALAGDGGGIYNYCNWNTNTSAGWTPEHYFEQLLIVDNIADLGYGGGIYTKQTFYCINSTIANNRGHDGGGAVACFSYPGGMIPQIVRPVFYNSILWGNQYNNVQWIANQVYLDDNACEPQFAYCDIEDFVAVSPYGFIGNGAAAWTDYGWNPAVPALLDLDPLFTNGYYLSVTSPLIDEGSTTLSYCTGWPGFGSYTTFPWPNDFAGASRVCQTSIDVGAFEYCSKSEAVPLTMKDPLSTDYQVIIQQNPWPAGQVLEISASSPSKSALTISISDLSGRIWCQEPIIIEGERMIVIAEPEHSLKPGMYFLHFIFEDSNGHLNNIIKKIIKI
ncbi:MAG: hypothetical protein NTU44_15955 [Bacteroidetes bacterium]|nr:hypothetical protein [Bacteroidota bacterium]